MQITNYYILKYISHLLVMTSIGYAIYLFLDLFVFVAGVSSNDGYRLFYLILAIPYPILISIIMNLLIRRDIVQGKAAMVKRLLQLFPLICLLSTVGEFLLMSLDYSSLMGVVCLFISILLFCIACVLFIYDLKH
ncbi:hypothetical protein GCM10010918_56280 [Paenibacillus radicis (ex Gao et al. 2016)]|uniref:Uncharacterized protein n=1 Tax=Paenibacillus radicis (ex Gao et al. 2016) TaxID=1737354 RepID=A0A917MBN8_9BACL|nr:hypothetical protein GCM10010918_56280 [Paenibacillus radicis (ex Gao et al. 2016)]